MRIMAVWVTGLLLVGCRSTNDYREASLEISQQLIGQLDKRVDRRRLRLYVEAFERRGADRKTRVKKGRLYYDHEHSIDTRVAEWFQNELNNDLAQQVRIVKRAGDGGPAANTVLKGRLDFVGREKVVIETRIVDLETKEVLATATTQMLNEAER